MTQKQKRKYMRYAGIASCVLVCSVLLERIALDDSVSWLPAACVARNTVGLHDHIEETSPSQEDYEPSVFVESRFILRENETFRELLDTENKLYISMEMVTDSEISEFTCHPVRGRNRERGYSCLNTPPSDILLFNPASMRFTRAAVGAWTFFSENDLTTGSSIFVEHGECAVLTSTDQLDSLGD